MYVITSMVTAICFIATAVIAGQIYHVYNRIIGIPIAILQFMIFIGYNAWLVTTIK